MAVFKPKTRDEWIAELADIDACFGPLYTIDEALNDPHAQARGVSVTGGPLGETGASFPTLPTFPRKSGPRTGHSPAPPAPGAHTSRVLPANSSRGKHIHHFKHA